jgi:nicotinamidase-related amidase
MSVMTSHPSPWLPLPPGSRSALLIIDMQNYFFLKQARRVGLEEAVANINRLSACFDERDWPVFHVISRHSPDGTDWDLRMKAIGTPVLITGTTEADILPMIERRPPHQILVKTRHSAFFRTDLDERLQQAKIRRVICCGAYTHYCVNATVFDAYYHDYVPGMVLDAVVSFLPEESQMLVDRMRRNGFHLLTTAEFFIDRRHNS